MLSKISRLAGTGPKRAWRFAHLYSRCAVSDGMLASCARMRLHGFGQVRLGQVYYSAKV